MTKRRALMQSLSREDKTDWLIADFLNLDSDSFFEKIPVRVKDLTESQARVALGICLAYIKRQHRMLKSLRSNLETD